MRRDSVLWLGALLLMGACAESSERLRSPDLEAFQRFLVQYHGRYPKARAEDYYKLIHQSVFGVGHLIEDEASARSSLEREILTLGPPKPAETLLEPLDPEGRMMRVNLRPFVAQKLSQDALMAVLLETARTVEPDTSLFLGRWHAFGELVDRGELDVPVEDWKEVDRFARERSYPPVHHSNDYRGAYKPAYRVVLKGLFTKKVPSNYRTR